MEEQEPILQFEKKAYPTVKIYSDYLEIKARDYWEFRRFHFSKIEEIRIYPPVRGWVGLMFPRFRRWFVSYPNRSYLGNATGDSGPSEVRFIKKNGGYWEYLMPSFPDEDYKRFHDEMVDIIQDWKSRNTNTD